MNKWIKTFCVIVLSFATVFIGVGYAATTGSLTITGNATAYFPAVYISSAVPLPAYANTATVNGYTETVLNSTAMLSTANPSVVYEVVVTNSSSETYGYLATSADPSLYQNSQVEYNLYSDAACTQKLERRTELPAASNGNNGKLTFYLKINAKTTPATATAYQSVLNIQFKTPVSDIPAPGVATDAVAVDNATRKFHEILNNPSSFSTLVNQMTGTGKVNANDRYSDSYIAYVPATIDKTNSAGNDFTDDNVCLELFGGELNLIIDGKEYQVYFLLKRENVDGSTATGDANGEEYTLYMTTNPLTSGSSFFNRKMADVYASVFTSSDDGGSWYQLGDMLYGEAPVCGYAGFSWTASSGSFHTDSWETKQAYYGVAAGNDVTAVMSRRASDLTALQVEIQKAEAIIAGDYYETIYTEASRTALANMLTVAKNVNSNSGNYTQAQVVTYTRQLSEAIAGLKDTA